MPEHCKVELTRKTSGLTLAVITTNTTLDLRYDKYRSKNEEFENLISNCDKNKTQAINIRH